jgi:hypothetical protein
MTPSKRIALSITAVLGLALVVQVWGMATGVPISHLVASLPTPYAALFSAVMGGLFAHWFAPSFSRCVHCELFPNRAETPDLEFRTLLETYRIARNSGQSIPSAHAAALDWRKAE